MPISRIFYRDIREENITKKLFEREIKGIEVLMPLIRELIVKFDKKEDITEVAQRIIEIESKIDNVRKDIDQNVYDSRFFPITFHERVEIGNAIDDIADEVEEAAKKLLFEDIKPYRQHSTDIVKLAELLSDCMEKTVCCARRFYDFNRNASDIKWKYEKVAKAHYLLEEQELKILKTLTKAKKEKDIFKKMLYIELIKQLREISNKCIDLASVLFIFAAKRV